MADFFDSILGYGEKAFDYITDFDDGLVSDVGSAFTDSKGDVDFGKVAGGIGALGKVLADTGVIGGDTYLGRLFGGSQSEKLGYQGKIPTYTATRQQIPGTFDPKRRPGSFGQRYFTDVRFDGGDTSGQAAGLQAMNLANLARETEALQTKQNLPIKTKLPSGSGGPVPLSQQTINYAEPTALGLAALRAKRAEDAAKSVAAQAAQTQAMAGGGIARLNQGMYLDGMTDGMADKVPAMIGNTQPAALSDGEFVIPADVVSGLGNGNSDAGAKNLYAMMDRVRQARTGTTKQAPAINPNKMMPTMRG